MKRRMVAALFMLVLCKALLFAMTMTASAEGYSGGDGTENNPYLISSREDFSGIADAVNNGNDLYGVYFKQTADIDMGGEDDPWSTVGITIDNAAHQFRGMFDGDNWQIINLYVNRNDDDAGLFGYVGQDDVIRNVHVVEGDISGTYWCGGIASRNYGLIEYCSFSGYVYASQQFAGGIAGRNSSGIVENCYNRGDVYARNIIRGYVGGVVGENTAGSTIDNCYSTGCVEGNLACGAIAGANGEGSTVQDCYYPDDMEPGLGGSTGNVENVLPKTEEEFESGKVAWELSKGTDGDGWGQNIAEGESHDKHPHFTQAPDKDYDTTEVYRVTFHSTNLPVDQKLYVDPGDNVDLPWLPENAKWYDADGQEFNGLNIQCDVDAIAGLRILFAGEMKTVEVAGIYSPLEQILPVNLNQYVQYADNGPSSDDRFEYTIIGDHDAFHATLGEDGRTLTIPAGTNVNETGYALTVQVHEKEPYIMPLSLGDFGTDDVVLNIRVIINKATPLIVVKPTVSEIRYGQSLRESALSGGEAQHPTAGVNVPGAFAWEKDSAIPTVPEAAAVGYAVTFTPGDTKNYNAVTTMVTLPVNKVNPTMMKEPEPKGGVYNGVAQELVEPGIAANGTMMYSLEKDGEYLPDSPARANADNYTVWYKVVGDENHNDLGPFSVEVTIRPYPVSIASQTVTYNGTQSFTVVLEGVNNETVVANLKPYSKDAGVYTYAAEEEGGKYTVGLSSSNYAVENGGELLINKLQAVLHWRHPLVFIHDNQPHEVAAVVSNAVEGDAVELLYQTDLANKITNSATDEGSYTAVVERLENSNYTLDGVQNASQRWYIIEKNENYKLSADRSEEIVYGDVLNLAFTISSDALREYPDGQIVFLVNGEKIGEPDNTSEAAGGLIATKAVKMTSANNFSAGANTVMAIYSDAEDGPHGFDAVSVWVIPKPIKAEVTGNAAKTYDGNDVAANLILELDGVEDCDEKAVTVAADSFTYSSKNVNEAATIIANQVVLSGARSGNYTLTSPVETVGRITARAVRLEWSGYEGLVYTGTPSMLRPRPQN